MTRIKKYFFYTRRLFSLSFLSKKKIFTIVTISSTDTSNDTDNFQVAKDFDESAPRSSNRSWVTEEKKKEEQEEDATRRSDRSSERFKADVRLGREA